MNFIWIFNCLIWVAVLNVVSCFKSITCSKLRHPSINVKVPWLSGGGSLSKQSLTQVHQQRETMLNRKWEEQLGSFVLRPSSMGTSSSTRPLGIIHFVGGAFAGAVPHLIFDHLLQMFAAQGFVVIATPYRIDKLDYKLDYLCMSDDIKQKLELLLPALQSEYCANIESVNRVSIAADAENQSLLLPVFRMGYGAGAMLQAIIASSSLTPSMFDSTVSAPIQEVERQYLANVLISCSSASLNKFPAAVTLSTVLVQDLVVPVVSRFQSIVSKVVTAVTDGVATSGANSRLPTEQQASEMGRLLAVTPLVPVASTLLPDLLPEEVQEEVKEELVKCIKLGSEVLGQVCSLICALLKVELDKVNIGANGGGESDVGSDVKGTSGQDTGSSEGESGESVHIALMKSKARFNSNAHVYDVGLFTPSVADIRKLLLPTSTAAAAAVCATASSSERNVSSHSPCCCCPERFRTCGYTVQKLVRAT